MKNDRKVILRWSLSVIMLLVLSMSGLAKETVVWWNAGSTEKVSGGVYKELVERFMELHPNIEVEVVGVSDLREKLLVAIATHTAAPDIFTYYFSSDVARHGWAEDLTPYLEKDGIVPRDVWFPISVNRISYDGRYYAVPLDVSPAGMGYNKSKFLESGLAFPGNDYDLDQFVSDLRRLNRPDDQQYALDYEYRGVGALEWTALAANLDVQLVSEDGQTVVGYLDTESTLDAFEWWADVHRQDLVQPSGVRLALWSGQVAFGTTSLWEVGVMRESDIDWDVFAGPVRQNDAPQVWADSTPTYMYSGSPNKDAAWQFMKWLSTSVEAGRIMAKYFSWAPPMVEAWIDLDLDRDPVVGRFWPLAQMEAAVPNYLRSEYQWDIIQPVIESAWDKAVVEGTGSIRALLKEGTSALQAQLDAKYGN